MYQWNGRWSAPVPNMHHQQNIYTIYLCVMHFSSLQIDGMFLSFVWPFCFYCMIMFCQLFPNFPSSIWFFNFFLIKFILLFLNEYIFNTISFWSNIGRGLLFQPVVRSSFRSKGCNFEDTFVFCIPELLTNSLNFLTKQAQADPSLWCQFLIIASAFAFIFHREGCFGTDYFLACVEALFLEEEKEKFMKWREMLGKK